MPTDGWSGLWNRHFNEQHALLRVRGGRIARLISSHARKRGGGVSLGQMYVLTSEQYKMVKGQVTPGVISGGGLIQLDAVVQNVDVLATQSIQMDSAPNTYPVDLSGNGGGGKNGIRI